MIRTNGTEYFVCYDATGEVVYGPFPSGEAALEHFDGLCSLDQGIITGRAPFVRGDSPFMKGCENGRQFQNDPEAGDFYRKEAEKAGVSITGKKYISQLATRPGDPQAWVSDASDMRRVCEERGWGCAGTVNVTMRERENPPPPPVAVDPKIVDAHVMQQFQGQRVPIREVMDAREKIADRLTPWFKKKGAVLAE